MRIRSGGRVFRQCISTEGGMSSHCDADKVVTNSSARTVEECSAHAVDKVSASASEVANDYATTSGLGRGR